MNGNVVEKRKDYISWDDYFMGVAVLSGKRSKDPRTQVGACIVNQDKIIVSTGYNGMPNGCNDDEMPWGNNPNHGLENKHYYVCHAELNAIMNKNSANVKNCKIYVTLFPCNECAKMVIQSGINEVIYLSDKHKIYDETKASKLMLEKANISYRQFIPTQEKITIDFDVINAHMNVYGGNHVEN